MGLVSSKPRNRQLAKIQWVLFDIVSGQITSNVLPINDEVFLLRI